MNYSIHERIASKQKPFQDCQSAALGELREIAFVLVMQIKEPESVNQQKGRGGPTAVLQSMRVILTGNRTPQGSRIPVYSQFDGVATRCKWRVEHAYCADYKAHIETKNLKTRDPLINPNLHPA